MGDQLIPYSTSSEGYIRQLVMQFPTFNEIQ